MVAMAVVVAVAVAVAVALSSGCRRGGGGGGTGPEIGHGGKVGGGSGSGSGGSGSGSGKGKGKGEGEGEGSGSGEGGGKGSGASYTVVAPTAHLEMESCPNTQGASSTHAWEELSCLSCPLCIWLGNYKIETKHVKSQDYRGILLVGVATRSVSPNGPLKVESMYQNFTYIFQTYMWAILHTLNVLFAYTLAFKRIAQYALALKKIAQNSMQKMAFC
jgi:hypothetical protein